MASPLASVAIVQAAEECRIKPGSTAPVGSRWLYRINRADHRHCWFLSSRAVGVRSQPRRGHRDFASDTVRQDQQQGSDLQTAFAPTEKTNVAVVAEPPALPQVAGPSVGPSPEILVPRSVPTITYRRPPPSAQITAGPTVSAERSAERPSAGASKSNVALVVGVAAAVLFFAGGVFHFTRRGHLRFRKRAVADRHGMRRPIVVSSSVAAKPPPVTTDWAEDLQRKLRELKRLRPDAPKSCNLSLSHPEQTIRQLADA